MHRGREDQTVSSLTPVGTLFREFVGVALWAEVEGTSEAAAVKRVRRTKEQDDDRVTLRIRHRSFYNQRMVFSQSAAGASDGNNILEREIERGPPRHRGK